MLRDVTTVLRNPLFARYFVTVSLSRLTGTMFNVAVVLLILDRTDSLQLSAFVVAAGTLPAAFSGPALGAWLDVTRSRRGLVAVDQGSSALVLLLIALWAGHVPHWLLGALAIGYGITRPLSIGAFSSVLPELVDEKQLPAANALETLSYNIAFIAGPALSGVLVATTGTTTTVIIEAVLTVEVVILVCSNRSFELRPPNRVANWKGAIRHGFAALIHHPQVRPAAISHTAAVGALGALVVLFPAFCLQLDVPSSRSGLLWAALAVGSTIGAVVVNGDFIRNSPVATAVVSFGLVALSALGWLLVSSFPVAIVFVFATGFVGAAGGLACVGIRQTETPPEVRGQVFTTIGSLHLGAGALSTAVAGAIEPHGGFGAVLGWYVALYVAAVLLITGYKSRVPEQAVL